MNYIDVSTITLYIIIFVSLLFTATSIQFRNCKCDSNLPFYKIHPKPAMMIVCLAFLVCIALLITRLAQPPTTDMKDWEVALTITLTVIGTLVLSKYPLTLLLEKYDTSENKK
jgi:amino acid transporter